MPPLTTGATPHDSCHHSDTVPGDTFGGLGTSHEFREEDVLRPSGPMYDRITGAVKRSRARRS